MHDVLNTISDKIVKYKTQYIQLIMMYTIVYVLLRIFCFEINPITHKNTFKKDVYDMTNGCFYETSNSTLQKISHFIKGDGYVVGFSPEANNKYRLECLTTNYNIIHMLMYILFGYMFPFFWKELIVCSLGYEIWEYYAYKCHDYSDIVYNCTGIFIGYSIATKF